MKSGEVVHDGVGGEEGSRGGAEVTEEYRDLTISLLCDLRASA
jgi:hypothetical protein